MNTTADTKLGGIPARALDWFRAGQGSVIATVVQTWGSAPRPVGSQLAIRGDGHMEGSVSGGCVEGAVIVDGLDAIEDGTARLLEFGVSDDEAFAVGLACGGTIRVLVEPVGTVMPIDLLEQVVAARLARAPVAYVADLNSDARRIADTGEFAERFRLDRSGVEEDAQTFVAIHNPPLKMIVVGGVHIAQHLLPLARACGYDPILVDPRPAFGSPERFPDVQILEDWPDAALLLAGLDARTAVVTLTHDAKLDDPAIKAALTSDVFYLGCLGSTRTHAKRITRLREAEFSDEQIGRIHAPVGLDIGGRSPAEIAVSVMAQITTRLRKEGA